MRAKGLDTCAVVPLDELRYEKHGKVICYPKVEREEFEARLRELKELKVLGLEFSGQIRIESLMTLGKGYVSVVVMVHTDQGRRVIKIRRTDSRRTDMRHEAAMLEEANGLGVGPRLFGVTNNMILMDYVKGSRLLEWLKAAKGRGMKKRIQRVLRRIVEDCWRLDQAGIDHGELNRASKHVIVDVRGMPVIVDFESASRIRRVSNVTSICQFLFIGSEVARHLKKIFPKLEKEELLDKLRAYKEKPGRGSLEELLQTCELKNVAISG